MSVLWCDPINNKNKIYIMSRNKTNGDGFFYIELPVLTITLV